MPLNGFTAPAYNEQFDSRLLVPGFNVPQNRIFNVSLLYEKVFTVHNHAEDDRLVFDLPTDREALVVDFKRPSSLSRGSSSNSDSSIS